MKLHHCSFHLYFLFASYCLLSSCQGKIQGLDDSLTPLAELKLSIKQSELDDLPSEVRARLRVGLVWLGINIPSTWCAEQLTQLIISLEMNPEDPPEIPTTLPTADLTVLSKLFELCRNPFGVSPLLVGPSAPLAKTEENGLITTKLVFNTLPPAEVLIGTPDSRIAYASLVVFDDQNNNQTLDLGFSFPPIFWDDQFGPDDDDSDEGQGQGQGRGRSRGWDLDEVEPDTLYSASFIDLLSNQRRLVFREGQFTESFFYPLGGCTPPQGFSIIEVEGDFQQATCQIYSMSEPSLLPLSQPSSQKQEVICEPTDVFIFQPPKLMPEEQYELICISNEELAVSDPTLSCKNLSIIKLSSCPYSEPNCSNPEWDQRDMPPSWWPCRTMTEIVEGDQDEK